MTLPHGVTGQHTRKAASTGARCAPFLHEYGREMAQVSQKHFLLTHNRIGSGLGFNQEGTWDLP